MSICLDLSTVLLGFFFLGSSGSSGPWAGCLDQICVLGKSVLFTFVLSRSGVFRSSSQVYEFYTKPSSLLSSEVLLLQAFDCSGSFSFSAGPSRISFSICQILCHWSCYLSLSNSGFWLVLNLAACVELLYGRCFQIRSGPLSAPCTRSVSCSHPKVLRVFLLAGRRLDCCEPCFKGIFYLVSCSDLFWSPIHVLGFLVDIILGCPVLLFGWYVGLSSFWLR